MAPRTSVVYDGEMMTDDQVTRALEAQDAVRGADSGTKTVRERQAAVFREIHDEGANDREIAKVVDLHHTQVRNIRVGKRSSASRRKNAEPARQLPGQLRLDGRDE